MSIPKKNHLELKNKFSVKNQPPTESWWLAIQKMLSVVRLEAFFFVSSINCNTFSFEKINYEKNILFILPSICCLSNQ